MTTSYPLSWPEGWTRNPPHTRAPHPRFRTTFTTARRELCRELEMMGAVGVVVSSWLPLRRDGMPFAEAARRKIEDPGVAVYFRLRNRPMVTACDAYDNVHDNLRSIGLAIAHLRGMDRHGGAHMMERAFAGFSALPPPAGSLVRRSWREVLAPIPDGLDAGDTLVLAELRYRAKAKIAHPDVGGSDAALVELNLAIEEARAELG